MKYSFLNDYSEGAHPSILKKLSQTNLEQHIPYGQDVYSEKAKLLIKEAINSPQAEVFFVSGGTQANLTVIGASLKSHEAVISAKTGHIDFHEAGAIEATGHKIITIDKKDGKLTKEDIIPVLKQYDFGPHVVKPKLVYISNSTELGTHYTKNELANLYNFCRKNNLLLYLDGARLGVALTAENNDLNLEDVANFTDVFTIGGTKNGALLGEAVVITNESISNEFAYHLKQRGALLSKGKLLGIQFYELFNDNLYFILAKHANKMAQKLAQKIKNKGFSFLSDSKTNQIFPVLPNTLINQLQKKFEFYVWEPFNENESVLRIVTSWQTDENKVKEFIEMVKIYG